jgi:hypothetical protein
MSADRYYKRAVDNRPNPLGWVALTIGGPLIGTLLALGLLSAINLMGAQNTAYAGLTHKTIRGAIGDTLTKDLTVERIQAVLLDAPDRVLAATPPKTPAPTADQIAAAALKRKAERTERVKPAATRLNGEIGRLTDTLTTYALADYLREHTDTMVKDAVAIQAMPTAVAARLDENTIAEKLKAWAASALDSYSLASAREALAAGVAIENVVVPLVDAVHLRASVLQAVTSSLDPADMRPTAATWASDIASRLVWAIIALVFCLALLVVVLNAVTQINVIDKQQRPAFLVWTAIVVAVAAFATYWSLPSLQGPEPLHALVKRYTDLYGLAMLTWSQALTVLTAVGGTALLAGTIATLWVQVSDKPQLTEQLRGFRALFNSAALLLFVGVLEITALFRWPTLFIGDDTVRAAMQGTVGTFAASIGALFSVLLLAAYVPATAALRRQAIENSLSAGDVADAMSQAGFGDLASQQALRLAQVLAPLLPGVISILLTA